MYFIGLRMDRRGTQRDRRLKDPHAIGIVFVIGRQIAELIVRDLNMLIREQIID